MIELISKQETVMERGTFWWCEITVAPSATAEGLPLRGVLVPLKYKTDQDIVAHLDTQAVQLLAVAQEYVEREGFHYLDRETNTIKARAKTEQDVALEAKQTELDDMKIRLETLENTISDRNIR